MTDNIITARLFIDMDGTLAAWQQAYGTRENIYL